MSTPWPPEMVAKFGDGVRQVLADLRKATSVGSAMHLLQGFDLTDDELRLALEKVPAGVPMYEQRTTSSRTIFNTAMWLAGASYRAIAGAQGVSHQSIADGVKRKLDGRKPVGGRPVPSEMVRRMFLRYQAERTQLDQLTLDALVEVFRGWLSEA